MSEATLSKQGGGVETVDRVVIRFAGDSGDGMQLTGSQFTSTTASMGNDLATLPDFPAEIRAPAGTLPGVSGFQIQFSSEEVNTPGDQPDVLVAKGYPARPLFPEGQDLESDDEALLEKLRARVGRP